MEETFNKVFSSELEEAFNKIKEINTNIILDKINQLSLLDLTKMVPDDYTNDFLSNLEVNLKKETNARYEGMKNIMETKYNLTLLNLKNDFNTLIKKNLDEKIIYSVEQMKSYIKQAKNESEILISKSIAENVDKLTSQQLRELNIDKYINNNLLLEIQKFHDKANSLFQNIKEIKQTKESYESMKEILENFIKANIKDKLNSKIDSSPPWPKNIPELLKEQNIEQLIPDTKYFLYLDKKPYEIIAREDGKISIPNIKVTENYRHEELPCWRNSDGVVYNDSYNIDIDSWFNPDDQELIISKNYVSQRNWEEGGHISVAQKIFGGGKPARPQQAKNTISVHICNPLWKIKSFDKSGSVSASLSNNNSDMSISGTGGSIHNIKLELI